MIFRLFYTKIYFEIICKFSFDETTLNVQNNRILHFLIEEDKYNKSLKISLQPKCNNQIPFWRSKFFATAGKNNILFSINPVHSRSCE